MVIHSVYVRGIITQVLLEQGGGSNMRVTNQEKEGTGYFLAGNGVCMAPNCEKNGKQKEVQKTKFTFFIKLLTQGPTLSKEVHSVNNHL